MIIGATVFFELSGYDRVYQPTTTYSVNFDPITKTLSVNFSIVSQNVSVDYYYRNPTPVFVYSDSLLISANAGTAKAANSSSVSGSASYKLRPEDKNKNIKFTAITTESDSSGYGNAKVGVIVPASSIPQSAFNSSPAISLGTANNVTLSEGNSYSISGSTTESDAGDVVTVKYKINNGTIRNMASGVASGTPLSFAKNLTFSNKRLRDGSTEVTGDLAENVDHVLTVWAEDDKGGKSAEITRTFRVIHNRPPVISGVNENIGTISAASVKKYSVTEPEGNSFTIVEKLNDQVIRSFAGVAGREESITISPDAWIRLKPGVQHTLKIEATDSTGMTSARTYTFTRSEDKLEFKLKQPFETDIAAKRILVTLDAVIPAGSTMKIEACNNGFDTSPTWEDITNHVRFGRGFLFTNTAKTAAKWGVDICFSFGKGTTTELVIVNGFGGAFD